MHRHGCSVLPPGSLKDADSYKIAEKVEGLRELRVAADCRVNLDCLVLSEGEN